MQTPTFLLKSFEELGAPLTEYGLYSIKPFKDWENSAWANKVFQMRLCNVGDLLDVFSQCQDVPENAKIQAMKIEILIRSIYSVDDRPLISAEELQKYNDDNNTELSSLGFLRLWMKNLEQVVVERLDFVYNALQQKQLRSLKGSLLCGECGTLFYDLPKGGKLTKHMACEVLCPKCMETADLHLYEFEEETSAVAEAPSLHVISPNLPEAGGHLCNACGGVFDTIEELSTHRLTCSNE